MAAVLKSTSVWGLLFGAGLQSRMQNIRVCQPSIDECDPRSTSLTQPQRAATSNQMTIAAKTQIVATSGFAARGNRHRAGFPRIGITLLAIQCALWLAVSSIIPQLHQAFANHRHIYCGAHHQIEDAGPKLDYVALIERSRSERSRLPALQNSVRDFGYHRACQFSSLAVNFSLRMPKAWHISSGIVPVTYLSALHGTDLPTPDILLVAPKQSPPAV
jgi:hypothetical protein